MSEEILRALMQLFALLTKQDGGVEEKEIEYVKRFLQRRISPELVPEYMDLFFSFVYDKKSKEGEEKTTRLTSVKDSVKILGICKKINKTLSQKQKIIVLVHLYELVVSDRKFTEQRMAIIDTAAEVFNIDKSEYKAIETFVKADNYDEIIELDSILTISSQEVPNKKFIHAPNIDSPAFILKVESVDLYFLRYTGKQNLILNSQYIDDSEVYLFSHGSILRLPKDKPVYYSDVVAIYSKDKTTLDISFNARNIEYRFKDGAIGLRDINISEEQGRLIGIMGASGSGKTTLLNVLCGIEKPSAGEVLINGINLHQESKKIKGIIGYVPQDDVLIEDLTVFENLFYNSKLCFKDLTDEEITEKVNQTLKSLGLYEKKDLKVGSPLLNKTISGGQRKRLNIALELIREPAIMFLDEPTSGLSSRDSENIMDLLRELVLKGKLIFVVIHQPSSDIYKMFDKVIILDSGYQIYYGNPVEAISYFKTLNRQVDKDSGECPKCGNVNPELIFNIIEQKVVDEYGNYKEERKVAPHIWFSNFKEHFKINQVPDKNTVLPSLLNLPKKIKQFIIYTKRDFYSKISNRQYLIINAIESPLLAFLLSFIVRYSNEQSEKGYIFKANDNIFAYIFIAVIVSVFVGMMVSAEEIFRDRKLLKRESLLNLSRSSYLFSKIFLLFSLSAIQSLLFTLVGNSIMGIKGMYIDYWIMLFTVSCVSVMIGLNISSAFNSAVTIYILIPLLVIPQMILSGGTFHFDKLNRAIGGGREKPPLIAEIIPARWGFEALVVHQFKENKYEKRFYEINRMISICNYKSDFYIPKLLDILDTYDDRYAVSIAENREPYKMKEDDVELLRNEITKEMTKGLSGRYFKFEYMDSLKAETFNPNTSKLVREYLNRIRNFYNEAYNAAVAKKDAMVMSYQDTEEKKQALIKLQDDYENDNLSDVVRNSASKYKVLRSGNELVQNMDKVYQYPSNTGFFDLRAHFYAPVKNFFGTLIPTYWMNILVLWIFVIILYVFLYFDVLKKIIEWRPDKKMFYNFVKIKIKK